jgi:hypothetical protein
VLYHNLKLNLNISEAPPPGRILLSINPARARKEEKKREARNERKERRGESAMTMRTSVSERLFPQKIAELLGPGFLDVLAGALQRVSVAGFSLAEPDFKFRGRVGNDGRQSYIRRFDAVLVDVDVEILRGRWEDWVIELKLGWLRTTALTFLSGNRRALLNNMRSSKRKT